MTDRRVISYSLFGREDHYCRGIVSRVREAEKVYRGWRVRIYYGDMLTDAGSISVLDDVLSTLQRHGAELLACPQVSLGGLGTMWRFMAAFDAGADVVIFRDADSPLTARERDLVDEWLDTDFAFHAIRDHEQHIAPMLAGMWGCRPYHKLVGDRIVCDMIRREYDMWMRAPVVTGLPRGRYWGTDQMFLAAKIWPIARHSCLGHILQGVPELRMLPTDREIPPAQDGHFIGEVYADEL